MQTADQPEVQRLFVHDLDYVYLLVLHCIERLFPNGHFATRIRPMSATPVHSQREPVLVRIALAPLRAIEQTRGWRRLGLLFVYGVLGLAIGAFLWRRSQLAAVPDIGEPFDVAAFRTPARVPMNATRSGLSAGCSAVPRHERGRQEPRFRRPTSRGRGPTRPFAPGSPSTKTRFRCSSTARRGRNYTSSQRAAPSSGRLPRTPSWPTDLVDRHRRPFQSWQTADRGRSAGAWTVLKAVVRPAGISSGPSQP